VRTLNKVDFPTLGRPTIPIDKLIYNYSIITGVKKNNSE
jgi:hypothetical protein